VLNDNTLSALPLGKKIDTHRKWGWVGTRAGLDGCGKLRFHRDFFPGRPAGNESLYRMHCSGRTLNKGIAEVKVSLCTPLNYVRKWWCSSTHS